MPFYRKLDITYYLMFWLMPIAVGLSWLLAILAWITQLTVVNPFGLFFLLLVSLSYLPLFIIGCYGTYPLRSPRTWVLLSLTVVYTYHWIPAMARGFYRTVSGQTPVWAKTGRIRPETYQSSLDTATD